MSKTNQYIGCYKDTNDSRDLPLYKGKGDYERCHVLAKKNNKRYFGLQNYQGDIDNAECWLGDSYGQFGSDSSKCDFNQDGEFFYGQNLANAVYQTEEGAPIESKQSYSEFRNQMQDWCQDLKDRGIYNQEEYQKCLQMYRNIEHQVSEGELNQMATDKIKYQYGFQQNPLYKTNPISTIVSDDYQKLYFKNKAGYFLVSNTSGQISMTKEPETDKEREWNLVKLSQNTYALRSTYGKYLAITPDLVLEANRNDISPWVQFILEKREDKHALKSKSHGSYLTSQDEIIQATPSWTQDSNWMIENKNLDISGQTFLDLYDQDHLMNEKNRLISRMEDSYKKYLEKGTEVKYATKYIQELELLRNRQINFLGEKINERIDQMSKRLETLNRRLRNQARTIMRFYFKIVNRLFRLAQSNRFGDLYKYQTQNTRSIYYRRQQEINKEGLSYKIIEAKNDIFHVYRTNSSDPYKVVQYIKSKLDVLSQNQGQEFDSRYQKIRERHSDLEEEEKKYQDIVDKIAVTTQRLELSNRFKPQIEEKIIKLRISEVSKYQKLQAELVRLRYLALDEYKETEKNVQEWKAQLATEMSKIQKEIDTKLSTINNQIGKIYNLGEESGKLGDKQKSVQHSEVKGDTNLELIEIQKSRHYRSFWGLTLIGFISLMMILILLYNVQTRFNKYYLK